MSKVASSNESIERAVRDVLADGVFLCVRLPSGVPLVDACRGPDCPLAFLTFDSFTRMARIRSLERERITDYPAPRLDASSATGYELGQHDLILPTLGTDGYQWILQTEQAHRDGRLRLHEVAYDNAPEGREAHWAAPLRWWSAGLAAAYHLTHAGRPERVLAAVITPTPDPYNMMLLWVPVGLLYELGILLCVWQESKAEDDDGFGAESRLDEMVEV